MTLAFPIVVSLFSILQEKEIQIRGFKLRLPINLQFLFTANPEATQLIRISDGSNDVWKFAIQGIDPWDL